ARLSLRMFILRDWGVADVVCITKCNTPARAKKFPHSPARFRFKAKYRNGLPGTYPALERFRPRRWTGNSYDGFIVTFAGTGAAKNLGAPSHFALEINAFPALRAHDSLTLIAGKLLGRKFDMHGLRVKEFFVRHFTVGEHLLLVFVGDLRM